MGLGKMASARETLNWPLTFVCGGLARMLEAYGSPQGYRNAPKMPAGLTCGFEEQRGEPCAGKGDGRLREPAGLSCGRAAGLLPTAAWRLELEKPRFENVCTSTTLQTLGLAAKVEEQDYLEPLACCFTKLGGCSCCPRLRSECLQTELD